MADARPHARIRVRAVPGSRRAGVVGPHGEAWKVRVTAAPEKGRANEELVAVLAGVLGVGRGDIEVVTGAGARDKLLLVRGIDDATAAERLGAAATP